MAIPTEPIGSVPRPPALLRGVADFQDGKLTQADLDRLYDQAVQDTIQRFEATGSPVISDGEQTKPSFATYPIAGLETLSPLGVVIPFADGHTRQLPCLTAGPFRYSVHAESYLKQALRHAGRPVKQAVISASALSLLYPPDGLGDYPRDAFLDDLVAEVERDIRGCLQAGAHAVQIDFTEARLSLKLDPSGALLDDFIALNNRVLARFTAVDQSRIGVHTCPGGDHNSTHSADVDYADLLPKLFGMAAGRFYVQLASEPDRRRVLEIIRARARPETRVFIGVIDPTSTEIESPEEVRDRILEAAEYLTPAQLGTTDDCGFSPFGDDIATARDTAFAKIAARVQGTAEASRSLGI